MDWMASALLLIGTWLITKKIRLGWFFQIGGSGMMCFIFWHRPPILILNAIFLSLAIKGFISWRQKPLDNNLQNK